MGRETQPIPTKRERVGQAVLTVARPLLLALALSRPGTATAQELPPVSPYEVVVKGAVLEITDRLTGVKMIYSHSGDPQAPDVSAVAGAVAMSGDLDATTAEVGLQLTGVKSPAGCVEVADQEGAANAFRFNEEAIGAYDEALCNITDPETGQPIKASVRIIADPTLTREMVGADFDGPNGVFPFGSCAEISPTQDRERYRAENCGGSTWFLTKAVVRGRGAVDLLVNELQPQRPPTEATYLKVGTQIATLSIPNAIGWSFGQDVNSEFTRNLKGRVGDTPGVAIKPVDASTTVVAQEVTPGA